MAHNSFTINNDLGSSKPNLLPPWEVLGFTFSIHNTDSELEVMSYGRRFIIHLSAANFFESPKLKEKYLFFLNVAENYEIDGIVVEDFWAWATEPFYPLFKALSPQDKSQKLTLQNFLFPETFIYSLRAVSEKLVPEIRDDDEDKAVCNEASFGVRLPDELCTPWQRFAPSEIQTCVEDLADPDSDDTESRVLLPDGTAAYFKLATLGDVRKIEPELRKYKEIEDAQLDHTIRISRLHGLVHDGRGIVFGLLLTYIDCPNGTLHCTLDSATPISLRQKWADQIRKTVGQLHNAGVVWGDAKPDNILIDKNEDAWLIDFGGGYTEGWVPKNLEGTVEGDLQALGKIMEFIGL